MVPGRNLPLVSVDILVGHIVVVDEASTTSHLAVRQVQLAERSNYVARTLSLGGALVRTDMGVTLDGEGAEAELDGLYVTDGDQDCVDNYDAQDLDCDDTNDQIWATPGEARSLVASAIVDGRAIRIEGGPVEMVEPRGPLCGRGRRRRHRGRL